MFFTASFAAAVINRFGCRIVSMCGSLLVTLGLVMASFASGITTMYLAFFLAGKLFDTNCKIYRY